MIWNKLPPTASWQKIRSARGFTTERLGSFVVNKYTFEATNDKVAFAEGHSRVAKNWTMMYLSTVSGCPVKCKMCGTSKSFTRMLTSQEMIEQIEVMMSEIPLSDKYEERLIKWMYMGEPMLNAREFIAALRHVLVKYPTWNHVISTTCPTVNFEPLFDVAREFGDRIEFTISVHGLNNEIRDEIIPYRQKHDLNGVIAIGEKWFEITGHKVSFSYNLFNSDCSDEEAQQIRKLFDPEKWVPCIQHTHRHTLEAEDAHLSFATSAMYDAADTWVDLFVRKLERLGYSEVKGFYTNRDKLERGCGSLIEYQKFLKRNNKSKEESVCLR